MNKKEVLEIKKQLTPVNCNITRIATCYVTGDKIMALQQTMAFLSLPEAEAFKYFDLFRKFLSGAIGKNLFNIPFATSDGGSEEWQEMEGLRKSRLTDDELLESFYTRVIEAYETTDNYLIILIHGMYDIPGRTSDEMDIEDSSEDVYEYIHCLICPVKLSAPGLSYDSVENRVQDRIRDLTVDMPSDGFLYPAFNDRTTDVNELLYYSKNAERRQCSFEQMLTGNERPLSSKEEAGMFKSAVQTAYGFRMGSIPFAQLQEMYEKLVEIETDYKDSPDDAKLNAEDISGIMRKCGVDEKTAEQVRMQIQEEIGSKGILHPSGIMDMKKFTIETPDMTIKCAQEYVSSVRIEMSGGRPCVVLPLSSGTVEVNGIETRLLQRKI